MQWLMSLYVAALFFVLTPGVLVSLPPGGKKMTVALVHALVFAAVYQLTHKMVWRALYEGFEAAGATATVMACEKDADCTAPMMCKSKKCSA
jgi:hypothetical protein